MRGEVESRGFWFGPTDRPTMGWLTHDPAVAMRSGVVIAPPTGYTYWCSHRTLRTMAERLARMGHTVLRFDYDGTGDSAGDQWDPGRVAAWQDTLTRAVQELRTLGVTEVTIIGVRIGATFALLRGRELSADRIVAWLPVSRGSRYTREIRLLAEDVPYGSGPVGSGGAKVAAGMVFSDETLQDLERLSLTGLHGPPAPQILVLDDESGGSTPLVTRLRELGATVDHVSDRVHRDVLETSPEYRPSGAEIVERTSDWLGQGLSAPVGRVPELPTEATLSWRGGEVREEVGALGPGRYAAVSTRPATGPVSGSTLVLLNTGAETHVGTGRSWVEYARDLAVRGYRTVRVDFRGWGESPDGDQGAGLPYDAECIPDTLAIVDALRAAEAGPVVICGLCASAWIALAAVHARSTAAMTDGVTDGVIDGVIAINPQLYWERGDPVEIDWDLIRSRRSREIRTIDRGARVGLWSLLDALDIRLRASRRLSTLVASGTRIELIFTDQDDGLVYLLQRLGRPMRRLLATGAIGLKVLTGIDHPMHRAWLRAQVVDALDHSLVRISHAQDPPGAQSGRHPARPRIRARRSG